MKEFFCWLIPVLPEVVSFLVIGVLTWMITKFKKIISQIPEMQSDIKVVRSLQLHEFERLDAQDNATKELFAALKNGRVNGEAKSAIDSMDKAKEKSDSFIRKMFFASKEEESKAI